MRTAFTQTLYDYVRKGKGRVVAQTRIWALCEKFGKKQSYGERQLRESLAPADIKVVYADVPKKSAVIGYRAIIMPEHKELSPSARSVK